MSKNLSHLSGRKGLKNNLFERIVEYATKDGTPGKEYLHRLADEFLVGDANTFGTASFYDFLKPENRGKKAYVCSGSACLMAGTQNDLQHELEKHLAKEEIGHMCCLGRCHENGAFHYDGHNYSARSSKEIAEILSETPSWKSDEYFVGGNMKNPILTAPMKDTNSYYAPLSKWLRTDPLKLLDEIKASNLRGRGGAGFPMGLKLESCRQTVADQKFIVCNADEGDPAAYSDRYLLEQQPHSVLLGMIMAGYMTGADKGVLYIRAEYPEAVKIIKEAIAEIEQKNLAGNNICQSGFSFHFKVIRAAGAYICGEETALLSSIEGQRPEVRIRPPYPTVSGLFNKPTAVNNVETLASVPYILTNGGKSYAAIGKGKSTGTKLVCLDSFFNRPGVYEVEMGTPLKSIVEKMGLGFKSSIKALHIGGPLGGIVPIAEIENLTLDFESFANGGFLLGHASILCIPTDFPMINYLEHLFEFTALESCGKCFPCRIGSVRGQEMIHQSIEGKYKIDRVLFDDLLETMETGSLCALGGGLPLGVKNALQYFGEELNAHFDN